MKKTPMLMCAEMVLATFDDEKGETRRVIKPQPVNAQMISKNQAALSYPGMLFRQSPYGVPGDRIWVKESYQVCRHCNTQNFAATVNLPRNCSGCDEHLGPWRPSIFMPESFSRITLEVTEINVQRLQDITAADVLKEGVRLRCVDGGILWRVSGKFPPHLYLPEGKKPFNATADEALAAHFASLWDTLNAKRGYAWKTNPFVWVVKFKRV
jgi:hypothetical protein